MTLDGKKIVMVLGPQFEDQEARRPLEFLREEGAYVDVAGVRKETLTGLHQHTQIPVDKEITAIKPDDYDAMVIPGGRSPANLRKHAEVVDFVRDFYETGKTVAAICHGPQLLAAAGLLKDKHITGYPKIREEMQQAGADFDDQPVVIDGNLITSRNVPDIPQFDAAIKAAL